jgi:RimJ/RimL family protein N-acetyltransferase
MNRYTKLIQAYRQKLSERSMPEILNAVISKARSSLYGNDLYILFERGLELEEAALSRRFKGELKLLRKDSVDITQFERYFLSEIHNIKHLFSLDLYCFVVTRDGDVVALVWFADKDFYDDEIDYYFKAESGGLYQFFGLIHPRFRRTSISHDILRFAWDYFREKGHKKVSCTVVNSNQVSLKLHKRLNFIDTGLRVRCRHFLWWKRSVLEDDAGKRVA